MPLERKAIDDIMGGSEAWKNADQTDATCPKCEAHRAYYQQLQIRSADEPMNAFTASTEGEPGAPLRLSYHGRA